MKVILASAKHYIATGAVVKQMKGKSFSAIMIQDPFGVSQRLDRMLIYGNDFVPHFDTDLLRLTVAAQAGYDQPLSRRW
jgi:hypothetical protein